MNQKENGEVRAQGFYLFYHIFKFIGGLALFLSIICLGALIYLFVLLIKGTQEEGQNLIGTGRSGTSNNGP